MARIRNLNLSVGRGASGQEFAEVAYDIEFSAAEQELDVRFDEGVLLFERDDALDGYVEKIGVDYGLYWIPQGNSDDFIGEIFTGDIRPSGQAVVHRVHRRDWSFPDNESGAEEYRALVIVIPQIRRTSAWSNEVSINLA